MDTETVKIVGQIAGIGGFSLGVLLIIFRDIISKNIFPTLTKENAYRLLRLVSILVWSVTIFGLGGWFFIEYIEKSKDTPSPTSSTQAPSEHITINNSDISSVTTNKFENVQGNVTIQKNSDARARGEFDVPSVYGMTYHSAREKMLKEGWIPKKNHWSHENSIDIQTGNGPLFWEKGYWELSSCSGTGYAYCRFEFLDPSSRVLVIVTAGEENKDRAQEATVEKIFFEDNQKNGEELPVSTNSISMSSTNGNNSPIISGVDGNIEINFNSDTGDNK